MGGFGIVGRGLKDTYESLFSFCLASLVWWLASFPVWILWPVLGPIALIGVLPLVPGATLALCTATDPRRAISRPSLAEVFATFRANLRRGLVLALVVVPIPLILLNNLVVFGGTDSALAALAPLWLVLILLSVLFALVAFSVAAMFEQGVRVTLQRTAYVLLAAPFRSLFVLLAVVLLTGILGLIVVPLILFGPALVATIVDRLVVSAFKLPVADPNAPTDERLRERDTSTGKRRLWGGK